MAKSKQSLLLRNKILLSLLLIVPFLLIFRAFFLPGPLVFGDAPYFYPENLSELFLKPLAWNFRTASFGAGQEPILWLYIPTFLMGLLYFFTGLDADLLIRVVFYFPATILAISGAYFFSRIYTKEKLAPILAAALYGFNTYFLLLIDGGQIGVSLAYGLFPWVILSFKNLFKVNSLKNFLLSTFSFALITNIDLRIAILAVTSFLFLLSFELLKGLSNVTRKKCVFFFSLFSTVILLNSFWIFPFIRSSGLPGSFNQEVSGLNLVSLLNSILLFNPHFPGNEFGKLATAPFYYFLLPLLIFGGLIIKPAKKMLPLVSALVIFIFLAKGGSEPLGQIYTFLIHLPFGISLRDSSKFFIPSLLISSVMLAISYETICRKTRLKSLIFGLIYGYLLFLVWPAIFGQMSGVLAGKASDKDYQVVYNYLRDDRPFFRSVWFPESPPLAFSAPGKEAVSGSELYKDKPFASMISGNYDLFYFLHDEMLADWFTMLGIKYAFFPEDQRKKSWSEVERENRQIFLQFVDKLPNFKRLNLEISFPGYTVSDPNPKIFSQEKLIIVLGDSSIFKHFKREINHFSLSNQGFIFLEDGIFNPGELVNIPGKSALLVFRDRERTDFIMTLLQDNFLSGEELEKSEWGEIDGGHFLDWKYKLLENGLESYDLGFGRGIHFSTQKNEKITFEKQIKSEGKYRLAFRSISASDSGQLKFKTEDIEKVVKYDDRFRWFLSDPISLKQGKYVMEFENSGGFQAINVVAVIPEDKFEKATQDAKNFIQKFNTKNTNTPKEEQELFEILSKSRFHEISYQQVDPTRYEIILSSEHPKWLVFTDHYSDEWKIDSTNALPFYSMVNGFYLGDKKAHKIILKYTPQEWVDTGLKVSAVSLIALFSTLVVKFRNIR